MIPYSRPKPLPKDKKNGAQSRKMRNEILPPSEAALLGKPNKNLKNNYTRSINVLALCKTPQYPGGEGVYLSILLPLAFRIHYLLFIAFFTSHRSPLSECFEQATDPLPQYYCLFYFVANYRPNLSHFWANQRNLRDLNLVTLCRILTKNLPILESPIPEFCSPTILKIATLF